MNEKLFKKIKKSGSGAIAVGIVTICLGVTAGVLMVVNGAKLLAAKADTLF